MTRKKKEGEILVDYNDKIILSSKDGAKIAFFEKEITCKDESIIVREYIYINYGSDKNSVLIKPIGEKRITNPQTGDLTIVLDKDFYKPVYGKFLEKKTALNKVKKASK